MHRLAYFKALRAKPQRLVLSLEHPVLDDSNFSMETTSVPFLLLAEIEFSVLGSLRVKVKLTHAFADVVLIKLRRHSVLMLHLALELCRRQT